MYDPKSALDRPSPQLLPLGDCGLLVRFSDRLEDAANIAAIALATRLDSKPIVGVLEVVPSLVSVFLRYDPVQTGFAELTGAVRLILASPENLAAPETDWHSVSVRFGGAGGPDLAAVAALCKLNEQDFVAMHNKSELRVLATGFAPGFVYCGLHPSELSVPRRGELHTSVPAGSILFAAGQTSITATDGPTGWHVIGRTDFRNFDAFSEPPTRMRAGDTVKFTAVT